MEKRHWAEEEIRILQESYRTSTKEELKKLLPGRSWDSILHKAQRSRRVSRTSPRALVRPNRIQRQLTAEEKAYISGIVDGEGTITLCMGAGKIIPQINMCNNHQGLITWIFDHIGCGTRGTSHEAKRVRPNYYIRYSRLLEVKCLLEQLLPYLIVKKKQADLLLRFCDLRLKDETWDYGQELYDIAIEIRKLNERGKSR